MQDLLEKIRTMPDIDADEHDGSYELVREAVRSLSKLSYEDYDVPDLDMLYFMAIGIWKGGTKFRFEKINKSNLPAEEKERLTRVFKSVVEKAKAKKYSNSVGEPWSVGMFGTGFYTFKGANKASAAKFIQLCVDLALETNEEEMLDRAKNGLKHGIPGMQAASASVILHCLKPTIFPVLNSVSTAPRIFLLKSGITLKKPGELAHYVPNAQEIKKFRDTYCEFRNYRALDIKLRDDQDISQQQEGEAKPYVETEDRKYMDTPISITEEQWYEMYCSDTFFSTTDRELMQKINDMGGEATATQLAERDGNHPSAYIKPVVSLATRVAKHTGCEVPRRQDGSEQWEHVLFLGSYLEDGHFNWRLRPELKNAIARYLMQPINGHKGRPYNRYDRDRFLEEVFFSDESYDTLAGLLSIKKSIIIQGPPGVGKTFIAKRLAYSIMGEKDDSRIQMIQFHQSYSYEDFVMGYRPDPSGFSLRHGIFYRFCKRAEQDISSKYYFIIDEINRGNLSKIFGEVFMLIEADKRNASYAVPLTYTEELFHIPANVYIIGTMNTADRSLAMIDYALRRRFTFFDIRPAFDDPSFRGYLEQVAGDLAGVVVSRLNSLNRAIEGDASLGKGFAVGHSYFCPANETLAIDDYRRIVQFEIIPLLMEYWFDDVSKVDEWKTILLG